MKEALKHRLVGAVVLTALAVIFLPGLLREQGGYSVDTSSQIPPQPVIPQVDFVPPQETDGIQPAPAPETMFLPEGENVSSDVEAPSEDDAPAKAEEQVKKEDATSSAVAGNNSVPALSLGNDGIPDAWVIQVVSLSNKEAADKLRDELQSEGYKAYVRSATTTKGSVTRVFIGPKLDKAEALAIKARVDKRLKVNSVVKQFKP